MIKPRNKYERDIVRRISTMTDQFEINRTKNGHIKVVFRGERVASCVFCGSPSDSRGIKNSFAEARQAINLAGVARKEA